MSVKRTIEDVAVAQAVAREAVWPQRFVDHTPTLGWTPTLPDDEAIELANAALRAAPRAFGNPTPAAALKRPADPEQPTANAV